jgi:ligand-binding sensor domain-containing protein
MKNIVTIRKQYIALATLAALGLFSMPGISMFGQQSRGEGISLTQVNAVTVDHENTKWFNTDSGIVSFDGENWKLYDDHELLPGQHVKSLTFIADPEGPALWIASPRGATVARLPLDEQNLAVTYNSENTSLLSNDVLDIAAGENSICWIGTARGVSALRRDKWLNPDYEMHYPESVFELFPITSMATNSEGDTCYVGTAGGGIVRIYRDNLDGISGASVYAQWGPIDLPTDRILSVLIAGDGTKWFGTEEGVARHTGEETLDNWTVFATDEGLIDNYVQAICEDIHGNIWFGTPAGLSVFDGSSWASYTTDNGLASNNILSMARDKNGVVWIGTDAGINSYENGKFSSY